jgi:hypothetical protein
MAGKTIVALVLAVCAFMLIAGTVKLLQHYF